MTSSTSRAMPGTPGAARAGHAGTTNPAEAPILWLEDVGRDDVGRVGGKNASLGEMIQALGAAGIRVPPGFATTAAAYRDFIAANGIEAPMREQLEALREGHASLPEASEAIRGLFLQGAFPPAMAEGIRAAYRELARRLGTDEPTVAVRSSATAEDLPNASFAGQHETFLNVRGEPALLEACRHCLASMFTERAISYRDMQGFEHMKVALSIGVQAMVRADLACSGIMFSIDTESGLPQVVVVSATWGLGEPIVQGAVDPDRYLVFKPALDDPACVPLLDKTRGRKATKMVHAATATRMVDTTVAEQEAFVLADDEILCLARWAVAIERHYGRPMDMEWAKDGESGALFIVQARPETVHGSQPAAQTMRTFRLETKGKLLLTGAAVGTAIASGPVHLVRDASDIGGFPSGAILVTQATDPDWVPLMRKAAGIVTDHGGATSHAAIVSRELGVPAVVGTQSATATLRNGQAVTLSCAEGEDGRVYDGLLSYVTRDIDLTAIPVTRTAMMLNIGSPAAALRWWRLPAAGVGLARMEFIITSVVRVHPMALVNFDRLTDAAAKAEIAALTRFHPHRPDYFVETLARAVARIAAPFHPRPVILRLSDFKSNEYAHLLGGAQFEPVEENPMLGLRGASRYYNPRYREGFALECRAIARARRQIGLGNIIVMVPFCRTPDEADKVLGVMAENGLRRGEDGLRVFMMCEIPSNVVLAEDFAARFDGFSIGSNDLTQLVLGVDRDSAELKALFDEQDEAVRRMIGDVIHRAQACGISVGLCGEAPSNNPAFAGFLVQQGINSISLNPDAFVATVQTVWEAEAAGQKRRPGRDAAPS